MKAARTPPLKTIAQPWDDARRDASLSVAMAARPAGPLRVFAYGSLIWDPCFAWTDRRPARLDGHARLPCLWSLTARGTPDHPGLVYGLDALPGGHCDGLLYTLDPGGEPEGLARLWAREMAAGLYRPAWLTADAGGATVTTLTFVADRGHAQYAGTACAEAAVPWIATAAGSFGTCADYYRRTVSELRRHGFADPLLERIVALLGPEA